ncbi:hypothetical protein KGA66_23060 [Actinocrinis puniceicyclus]|uniref:Uncharacterized protein n=1 Tax=Actinocrinis puniceicyclus TaxID=977794 RepID=A0A8J7WVI7_9ACTN|nr:hypothetical protein [Actinocrinis puniceicyclus]MBS2965944.1 hypothetical protein [Actinocrinis puniceicyclus]
MNSFDDRHAAPPTVGPSAGRVRARPRQAASRLTRRPRSTSQATASEQDQSISPDPAAPLIEWHAMSEPQYVLAWEQLRAWTTWLIGRYRLVLEDRLPACWPQHPELIEELWALRAWRSEAYGPEGTGQSAVYWHQALIAFLGHVSGWWAGGCRAGHTNPDTDLTAEQTDAWAQADPLGGIPPIMRPTASILTDPATDPGAITMPHLNVLTAAQMQALTRAGLAHPQHETIAAFTYYDGSWWAYASRTDHDPDAVDEDDDGAVWFRADDVDLASDHTFYPQPIAAK